MSSAPFDVKSVSPATKQQLLVDERTAEAEFDAYAAQYDAALDRGISASGEDKTFFAAGRLRHLSELLVQRGVSTRHVLDFGCGTGTAAPYLIEYLQPQRIVGIDISAESLEIARRTHGAAGVEFHDASDFAETNEFDLAFCNGVFHHIPLEARDGAIDSIYRSLRPGGLFAMWENNPWNPGTRYVMSRIPFDRDAITLTPLTARRLVRKGGFDVVRTDFLFIFPHILAALRPIERFVCRLPLGAQYLVLASKPASL